MANRYLANQTQRPTAIAHGRTCTETQTVLIDKHHSLQHTTHDSHTGSASIGSKLIGSSSTARVEGQPRPHAYRVANTLVEAPEATCTDKVNVESSGKLGVAGNHLAVRTSLPNSSANLNASTRHNILQEVKHEPNIYTHNLLTTSFF
jgi:hypothetical protein